MDRSLSPQSRAFASVFSVPSLTHTIPTPVATPDTSFVEPGQLWGGMAAVDMDASTPEQQRLVRRNLAWSTATAFLSMPKAEIHGIGNIRPPRIPKSAAIDDALRFLLVGDGVARPGEQSIVEWYLEEIRLHFDNCVKPALHRIWKEHEAGKDAVVTGDGSSHAEIVSRSTAILYRARAAHLGALPARWDAPLPDRRRNAARQEAARQAIAATCSILLQSSELYMVPLKNDLYPVPSISGLDAPETENASRRRLDAVHQLARTKIEAQFASIVDPKLYSRALAFLLCEVGCAALDVPEIPEPDSEYMVGAVLAETMALVRNLGRVGLGGAMAEKACAMATEWMIQRQIHAHCTQPIPPPAAILGTLYQWISSSLRWYAQKILGSVRGEDGPAVRLPVSEWQAAATEAVGRRRIDTFTTFVLHRKKYAGALLDVKAYLQMPNAKKYIIDVLPNKISKELLHAGESTETILGAYISMIHIFLELDPKAVLLDRLAAPIRARLRERPDTARIIIRSFLASKEAREPSVRARSSGLCPAVAHELHRPKKGLESDTNWDDLDWTPPPLDASADYQSSRTQDVTWYLLTVWKRDNLIEELEAVLGADLLERKGPSFDTHKALVDLIQSRLGDEKLQSCDVMLSDMSQSEKINSQIHIEISRVEAERARVERRLGNRLPPSPSRGGRIVTFDTRILSSYFWPELQESEFALPWPVRWRLREFADHFERIKKQRKLNWLPALGRATVELQLTDRTVTVECTPWQASVIYAFQPSSTEPTHGHQKTRAGSVQQPEESANEPVTRTVSELAQTVEMEETLVRQALVFWVGESVMRAVAVDTYTVLETLDGELSSDESDIAERQAEAAAAAASSAAEQRQAELLAKNKDLYRQFILGMLTNQGKMNASRVHMMLKVGLPSGFTFGEDGVRALMDELVQEGKVAVANPGEWAIKK